MWRGGERERGGGGRVERERERISHNLSYNIIIICACMYSIETVLCTINQYPALFKIEILSSTMHTVPARIIWSTRA